MAFFDKFPYTNFQELNLDWIMKEVAGVRDNRVASDASAAAALASEQAAKASETAAAASAQAAAESEQAAAGSEAASADYLDQIGTKTAGVVADWLEENLQPTTPPVDSTLTVSGAAADAKVTGDKISALNSALAIDKNVLDATVYVDETTNIFNRSSADNLDGYSLNGSTGEPIHSSGSATYTLSYFIPVIGCKKLSWVINSGNLRYAAYYFYGMNYEPLSGGDYNDQSATYKDNVEVPENAYYFRFSFQTLTTAITLVNSAVHPSEQIVYNDIDYKVKQEGARYVLEVSPFGDKRYSTINAAYADAYQIASKEHPVTILLYPGTYKEVLETTQRGGVYAHPAYVSFVGVNKHDVIWRDDSGLYANSPLHTVNPCIIRGITFIATHDDDPAFESTYADHTEPSQQNYGAYGLHIDGVDMDYDAERFSTIIQDCIIISKQNAAIGIGLQINQDVIVKNCDIIMDIPAALSNAIDSNKGAFLFHRVMEDEDTHYQHLVIDTNNIETNMPKAIFTYTNGGGVTVDAMRNMLWSDTNKNTGSAIYGTTAMFTEKSYGNNIGALNKATI